MVAWSGVRSTIHGLPPLCHVDNWGSRTLKDLIEATVNDEKAIFNSRYAEYGIFFCDSTLQRPRLCTVVTATSLVEENSDGVCS